MRIGHYRQWLLCAAILVSGTTFAQEAELHLRIVSTQSEHRAVPAVIWLNPVDGTLALPFLPHGHPTLTQKNRMFYPHLQVIPVGTVVQFPNADPFFHNVFSLFNGKRFDLGLYEAGSSKSITFQREGVSYIFCNIHPEMSAIVLALTTPLYTIADEKDAFVLRDIPTGDYMLNFWIEGAPQSTLDGLQRHVHVSTRLLDLGELKVSLGVNTTHPNKFGGDYQPDPKSPY
jgi:hypothetical protein